MIDAALAGGVNIMDVFMSEPEVRSNIGKALKGRREQVILQGHIGAAWLNGQYTRTRNIEHCKTFFEDFMKRLDTDYVDIGMIHFVDTEEDYKGVFESEVIEYAKQLKAEEKIKAIGMSSHNPGIAERAVKTGLIDVLMFSINPVYDLMPEGVVIDDLTNMETYQQRDWSGIHPDREQLYKTCESMGVGITVMKSLAAGNLLKAETSPFGMALTPVQCIQYVLTRPAVASALVGCKRRGKGLYGGAEPYAEVFAQGQVHVLQPLPAVPVQDRHCTGQQIPGSGAVGGYGARYRQGALRRHGDPCFGLYRLRQLREELPVLGFRHRAHAEGQRGIWAIRQSKKKGPLRGPFFYIIEESWKKELFHKTAERKRTMKRGLGKAS